MATAKKDDVFDVLQVNEGATDFILVGDSPFICNAMSHKVGQELLLPKGRKSSAERAMTAKHSPPEEFRRSMYYSRDKEGPTAIVHKATAFKKALMGAALDIPGAKKAQIGRLAYVVGDEVPIYGIPEIMLSVVRSADINKTPDIRTRAIIPQWCAVVSFRYMEPILKGDVLAKLLSGAGMSQGVGDWRVEKGSGSYGRFHLAEKDDPQAQIIMEGGGRAAQEEAIKNPQPYDSETEALLDWWDAEFKRRGFKVA